MSSFSIIVCCYNSSKRLPETIKHFSQLRLNNNDAFEVIIVDNASTDDTAEVANQQCANYNIASYKVINESTPGKSAALRTGIRAAKYEYIIICDDDNWLDDNYFNISADLMHQYPSAAVLGGEGTGVFESGTKPDWFDDYNGVYAVGPQATEDGIITKKGYVYGAGSVWLTKVLLDITELPQILTCRIGNKLSSAGDSELCYKAIIMGYDLVYSSQLKYEHFMPLARLNKGYIDKFFTDSAPDMLYLHGLIYKAGLQEGMFNTHIKRTWWGQVIVEIKNYLLLKNKSSKMLKIQVRELLKMNYKYDKSFK